MTSTSGPQRAPAQLTTLSLADHALDDVVQRLAELVARTVPGTDAVSVTLVEHGRARTPAATGEVALALDERQYADGRGPCLDCIAAGSPVLVPCTAQEQRWPGFVTAARERGVGSALAVPVPVQPGVAAALNVYSRAEDAFDASAVDLLASFAAIAGVALANAHLYEAQGRTAEQLQAAMRSRAAIEQAKGVLMGRRGCSAQEAFDLLVQLSQHSNRKLRDVAQDLLDSTAATDR